MRAVVVRTGAARHPAPLWSAVLSGLVFVAGCGDPEPPADDMVEVPAGTYTVGTNSAAEQEGPAHQVTLAAFEIDAHEVTQRNFKSFISSPDCPGTALAGNPDPCVYDGATMSNTYPDYWSNTAYLDFPVINVRWDQADAYCRWVGKRLPTEAEWEAAASGGDGRRYPWGDGEPTCDLANFENCNPDVIEVEQLEGGISPFGAYDMAGNVAEWVADWYSDQYYGTPEAADNPQGPINGSAKVVRGGSWYCPAEKLTTTFRDHSDPLLQYNDIGFRCARSL